MDIWTEHTKPGVERRRDRTERQGRAACVLCGRAVTDDAAMVEVSVDGTVIPAGDPRSGGRESQGAWPVGSECARRLT